jgi:hypothetical protein
MFEKILDRIEGEGADLPGTLTKRESRANWFEISPGIKGACCMSTARRTGNIC